MGRILPLVACQVMIGPVDARRAHTLAPALLVRIVAALGVDLADRASLRAVFDQHIKAGSLKQFLAGRLPIRAQVDAGGNHHTVAEIDHHTGFVSRHFLGLCRACVCKYERQDSEQSHPSGQRPELARSIFPAYARHDWLIAVQETHRFGIRPMPCGWRFDYPQGTGSETG